MQSGSPWENGYAFSPRLATLCKCWPQSPTDVTKEATSGAGNAEMVDYGDALENQKWLAFPQRGNSFQFYQNGMMWQTSQSCHPDAHFVCV